MKNGLFTIDWANIKSALMYAVIVGVVAGLTYILDLGDTSLFHVHSFLNVIVDAVGTFLVVLGRNFLTTNAGKFSGVQVISK